MALPRLYGVLRDVSLAQSQDSDKPDGGKQIPHAFLLSVQFAWVGSSEPSFDLLSASSRRMCGFPRSRISTSSPHLQGLMLDFLCGSFLRNRCGRGCFLTILKGRCHLTMKKTMIS